MTTTTIRSLLEGIIDYAGLFPPASLDMSSAVEEFARQRQSQHAWMLGRFVVPVGRLDEMERAAENSWGRENGAPWGLSVLVPGDLAAARQRLDTFHQAHAETGQAVVESIERQVASPADVQPVMETFADLEVYLEVPHREDPSPFMAALAQHGGRAKIRSGGVTADAFPTPFELARFMTAASRAGVAFKATAGLHHPLRGDYRLTYEPASPSGTMFGFLNVFLAAAWVKAGGLSSEEIEALLSERDASAITCTETSVQWRDHRVDATALAKIRTSFATSYGSCSFQEPVSDLQALGLLNR